MGFFDIFKRKKEITPKQLCEMMDDIRKKYAFVEGITDKKIKMPQARALVENINAVSRIVAETLNKVEKNIKNSTESTWWALDEAHAMDYKNLQKGEALLQSCKKELEEMLANLGNSVFQKTEEQSGPSNG